MSRQDCVLLLEPPNLKYRGFFALLKRLLTHTVTRIMIRNTSRIEIIELVSPILLLLIIITCSGIQNLKKYAFYLKPSRPEYSKAALFLTTQERLMPASTI